MKVCVTGGSGKAGRAVVADLLEHGHQVVSADLVRPAGAAAGAAHLHADLTDYGQAVEALAEAGADAVVHLANIPAPGLSTPAAWPWKPTRPRSQAARPSSSRPPTPS